ncbi:MAG: SpoVG family protein [Angelakisella sp.]|jgi:stage V sporulation protein G|nr:SpoVG family protein [Angelakisella sp.]
MKIDMKVQSLEQEGKCLARLSATLDDCFAIRGLRLMEGKNGLFVNFPSYKGRSGYVDICFPTTAGLRQQMTEAAVTAYHQALEHHQTAAQAQPEPPRQKADLSMQMG